jgi:hypothetical protein
MYRLLAGRPSNAGSTPDAATYLSVLPYAPRQALVPNQLRFEWTPSVVYLVARRSWLGD